MAKRRDSNEMQRLLTQRRRRGLSWAELSEESGVPRSTLCWWHRRLRRGDTDGPAPRRFVQLVSVPPPIASLSTPIEIVLDSGWRVVVRSGFDTDDLRRVFEAFRS